MHRLVLAAAYAALSLALTGSTACGSDTSSPAGPLPDTGPVPAECAYAEPTGAVFYVAVNGNDESGDGSETSPWGTITHATRTVPDGSTVLVQPGTYEGPIRLAGHFSAGITIRAATLYQTRLRTSSGTVMFCHSCQGITIEGFDIAHSGEGAGPLVIHFGDEEVKNITVRNNIIHDSFNNDLLKVNNGATGVIVERNVFYNQQGSDEHIDINSAVDVLVQDNVFLNSFEGSGRINRNDTSAYIVVKDSNGRDDSYLGAERVVIRRNVFFNWEGSLGYNFVLIGEDGADYIEARDVLVENNLLLGNSSNDIRAPFGVKSGENITFRNNTIAGDMPGISFAMRVNIENQAIRNTNIRFFNNIWSDPTGTMSGFSATPPDETRSFELDNNLYWNGGQPIPSDADELINPDDDAHAVLGDPLLDDQSDIITPVWQSQIGRFGDGSNSTCVVLEQLVVRYAATAPSSAAIDMGRADEAPDHDILGRPRDGAPDIGAYEH